MIDEQKLEESDLIDEEEFTKRLEKVTKKCEKIIIEFLTVFAEDKLSWGALVEINAKDFADKVAVKFEDLSWTYKEFNEIVNQYANYFYSLGLRKGDDIVLLMTKSRFKKGGIQNWYYWRSYICFITK